MIGIITLYYNNYNIGGLLQAYALQRHLKITELSQNSCQCGIIRKRLSALEEN